MIEKIKYETRHYGYLVDSLPVHNINYIIEAL